MVIFLHNLLDSFGTVITLFNLLLNHSPAKLALKLSTCFKLFSFAKRAKKGARLGESGGLLKIRG